MNHLNYETRLQRTTYDMRIGATIKRFRAALGISQTQLGALVGVHQAFIAHIERGKRTLSQSMLMKIAQALHCTVEALSPLMVDPDEPKHDALIQQIMNTKKQEQTSPPAAEFDVPATASEVDELFGGTD